MRHVQITRLTWALTGLFAAGAVVFAASRPAPEPAEAAGRAAAEAADPAAAAAAFDAHCARCHGPREFPYWASLQADPEKRRAWLERLLQNHYPPPEEERALVIDHIERTLADAD
jgi:cytochrome c5